MNRRQFSNPALAVAACLMLFVAAGSFAADPAPCEAGSRPCPPAFALNRYRIGPPQFALPFHLFNGHMLIDGAVNGHAGKFLFDTGTEFPFFLNNHFLALAKDQRVGSGKAASGQEMVLYRQGAPLPSLEIAGQLRFENLPGPVHTDWRFLEQAYSIPSFLGSIGHGFNQNYIFVIDYDAQTIVFHAQDQDDSALAHVVDPARVLCILAFTAAGVDGKLPEIELQVGDEAITAYFDTGNQGSLELTETMASSLEARGHLSLAHSEYAYGMVEPHTRARLKGLRHGQQALHDAEQLFFRTGSRNRVGLGFNFMKNYVTVWDYKRQTLTLLSP